MYITNRPSVALIAEAAGVDRIFVDMEFIGKEIRQGGMDTVKSHHTFDDIKAVSSVLTKAETLVRINPVHDETNGYPSTEKEVDLAMENGADIIMLPYFKTVSEVDRFVKAVGHRRKTMLLLETPEAAKIVDEILSLGGFDEIFIGLNDLSLGYKKSFMFELLANGTVETLCEKFKAAALPYGFGGIAAVGKGALPAEYVIREHYRLGSGSAILSRSFCNTDKITDENEVREIFENGLREIRETEKEIPTVDLEENAKTVKRLVKEITK